ncbi:dienelactone hydrolase family protein [Legionella jordanis]|uniref:Dienelactone hydrolase domain-containing protein n=1 Tax=Legionella jordanis TaxID=456 RepID=A0A0W0VA97_9GAMM|nr:alpha/beta hydrolase [Legionella jordanis]KTD17057.1 hypothetical protein Ljor_1363 [Legionella jordanis]VEH12746.1 Alpha/beta hydrolase family [Legionella jordanis]
MTHYSLNMEHAVNINGKNTVLHGFLYIPKKAVGLVLFAHGSGSSRFSTRNQFVAKILNKSGIASLLFDLLTPEEEIIDLETREFRFNVNLLSLRLLQAADWCLKEELNLPMAYFGASTGAAAALIAETKQNHLIQAVVSRGGRPDLAGNCLHLVKAPTLLIVGANDEIVINLNKKALAQMSCIKKLEIVPGASHLFEEPGTLSEVARLTRDWFLDYLKPNGGKRKLDDRASRTKIDKFIK